MLCVALTAPTAAENDTVTLGALTPASKDGWVGPASHTDNKDAAYANSFKATATGSEAAKKAFVTYNLEKNYTKLAGKLAGLKGNPEASKLQVKIYTGPVTATATPAYTSPEIKADSNAVTFEVNLADVQTLTIEIYCEGGEASVILADMQLTAVIKTVGLGTLTPASKDGWAGPASHTDNTDAAHANSLKATAAGGTKAYASYNAEKKYTKLTGKLAVLKGNPADCKLQVKVFTGPVTGTAAYTSPEFRADSAAVTFEVNLTDVQTLTIEVYNADTSGDAASVILADMQLTAAAETVALSTLTPASKDGWAGPASHTDNKDAVHANSFKATATGGKESKKAFAAYAADKKYTKLTGKLAPLKGTPEGDKLQVKIYTGPVTATATPAYTSPEIKADSNAVTFEVNLTDASLLTIEVYNTGSEASVILADMLLTPKPATPTTDHYVAVSGWTRVYEFVNADGSSKSPKKFVYAADGKPENGYDYQLSQKESKFYAEYFKNNVYVALKTDGTFDLNDAIWAGPDKLFGTADDKVAVKKADNGYYYEQAGEEEPWKFLCWATDVLKPDPNVTTTAPTTSTTADLHSNIQTFELGSTGTVTFRSAKDYTDASQVQFLVNGQVLPTDKYILTHGSTVVTLKADYLNTLAEGTYPVAIKFSDGTQEPGTLKITKNPFFNDGKTDPNLPQTGREFNLGLTVSMLILLMGGGYCGYRWLRRDNA